MAQTDPVLARIEQGEIRPFYLVTGDRIVSEPAAIRLGEALAKELGCDLDVVKRPESLTSTLQDLRTFALFASGKVTVVVESGILADAGTAPALVDEALGVLPLDAPDADLTSRERRAAACLLKALRLYQIDPFAGSGEEVVAQLPETALEGGSAFRKKTKRRRSGPQRDKARGELPELLEAARREQIHGLGESDEEILAEIVREGLPEAHALVMAESAWTRKHPLVASLEEAEALIETGQVSVDRKSGWAGLETVCDELRRETGIGVERDALSELARRTLRKLRVRGNQNAAVDSESTARFAAEYRKLANLAAGSEIEIALVREVIEDRGEEDVWGVLDAVGEGRGGEAVVAIDRLLHGAADIVAERLSLFSLLAGFCRQLTAVDGMVRTLDVPLGERNYPRFKARIAPRLQADLADGRKSPLAGLHPFRLHRVYLAASRMDRRSLERLPARVLDTERRLKGESVAPDAALLALVADLVRPAR